MSLLEGTVNNLMTKFGAGNHKPGSGSAAAFQCMVSAKLISNASILNILKNSFFNLHICTSSHLHIISSTSYRLFFG